MMTIVREKNTIIRKRKDFESQTVGLVPTMGNLHQGHLSLIQKSLEQNDVTIVTIFVNPKQFGKGEDLNKYPRTLDQDLEKIETLLQTEGQLIIFAPKSDTEVYPPGFNTTISVQAPFAKTLCALQRPGHFDGVATVIYQLFHLLRPHVAYFGQKDLQQFHIIKKLVYDLDLDVNLKMSPIVRDHDGLALSSRNQYLNPHERKEALTLFKTLKEMRELIESNPQDFIFALEEKRKRLITNDPKWEYLEFLDAQNLEKIDKRTQAIAILGAYKLGSTRLIDNIVVRIDAR